MLQASDWMWSIHWTKRSEVPSVRWKGQCRCARRGTCANSPRFPPVYQIWHKVYSCFVQDYHSIFPNCKFKCLVCISPYNCWSDVTRRLKGKVRSSWLISMQRICWSLHISKSAYRYREQLFFESMQSAEPYLQSKSTLPSSITWVHSSTHTLLAI